MSSINRSLSDRVWCSRVAITTARPTIAVPDSGKPATRRRWFPVPLWFAEGVAEWFSSEWDNNADMWLRDATIYNWVIPLHQIYGGYQVYKEGQSAMRYIAATYGEDKVVEIFKSMGRNASVDRALSVARRIRAGTLSVNGHQWFHADTPFGGYKQSGLGRENGTAGFEEYLETKVIALPVRDA